jgi:hypothetical protein
MGQIIGVDTSLITSIAGVNASEISKIGEVETEYIDNQGNPVKLFTGAGVKSTNLPYIFIPGNTIVGAEFERPTDVEEPSSYKIIGGGRANDTNNPIPTAKLNNFKNKLYKLYNTTDSQTFTISQWFKINDFPRHFSNKNGNVIRKKATSISRYDFKSPGVSDKLSAGFIEFGAIGPYYRKSDDSKPYKGIYVPFSLGVFINNGTYPVSLYTDYAYQLNTWYMVSLKIEGDLTNTDRKQQYALTLYINGENVSTAIYHGRLWSLKQRSRSGHQNRKQVIATSPGFADFYNNIITNKSQHYLNFKKFINLFEMNYVSFSPTVTFGGNVRYNTGISQPYHNNKFPFTNSRIDFGRLTIDQNSTPLELYNNTSENYPNTSLPPTSGIFIVVNNDQLPEGDVCNLPLGGQITAYYNSENRAYFSDLGFNEKVNGNYWFYKDLDNNWIVQIAEGGDAKIITYC